MGFSKPRLCNLIGQFEPSSLYITQVKTLINGFNTTSFMGIYFISSADQMELHPLQYSSAPTAPRQPAGTVHSMSDHHRRFCFATVHCDRGSEKQPWSKTHH